MAAPGRPMVRRRRRELGSVRVGPRAMLRDMTTTALISIHCPDRVGLIAAITGRLFDLGCNLADTTFAVLGSGAEFTAVVEVPESVALGVIESELAELPELVAGRVRVAPFTLEPTHGPSGHVTHRITVSGGDRPGLVARLSEVFGEFGANIVRLNAEKIPGKAGFEYAVIVSVSIPADSARVCLATVANTAGGLGLSCDWEEL